ncbi:MAG TPA: ribose-phosphate diphosphokinase [Candidatus Dormibacteraeota bacterium]
MRQTRDRDGALTFIGTASTSLGGAICDRLGRPQGAAEVLRFSEGGIFVRIDENVRGRHTFVVQSTLFPANDQLIELTFWLDALKRASAASVTAVIPYFNYAKGDKLDQPRTSIRARVCADMIQNAGADAAIMLDLHSPQVQGFFTRPADELRAVGVMCDVIRRWAPSDLTVVSPDSGYVKRARDYAARLDAPLAIADKRRTSHQERAEVSDVIGEVRGRNALIVDDFVISGRTLVQTARKLVEKGALSVMAAVTHGVFSPEAREVLEASPIEQLLVTDSVEGHPWPLPRTVRTVSVAPLFAEAISRAHRGESISVLSGTSSVPIGRVSMSPRAAPRR